MMTAARDIADSPRASYRPDIAAQVDSLPDHLREKIESYTGPVPLTLEQTRDAFFSILAAACREMDCQAIEEQIAGKRGDLGVAVELLELISRDSDRHYAMRALCMLRLLGREPRSLQAIADELGTTKANVNKCYRQLQDRLGGMPGRADKSPVARAKYRRIRLGQKRPRPMWGGRETWHAALRNALILPPMPLLS
jgi:hypothetical protein